MFKYRPYQEKCESDVDSFLDSSFKKGILVSPVGTGKALYTSMIAKKINEPTLIVQPNKELLEQNIDKARMFGLDPSIYSASLGKKDISNLTYATPMSIASKPEDFKHFHTLVYDEADFALTNTIKNNRIDSKGKFVEFLESLNLQKIIGMTATPVQLVSNGVAELKMMNRSMRSYWYKSEIFHITQIKDIYKDYWAKLFIENVELDNNVLELNSTGREFKEDSIIEQYDINNIDDLIIDYYEKLLNEGKDNILTFMPSVKQAIDLKNKNKDFEVVYDKTPAKERTAIVNAFKRGDIPMLLNCSVFEAGFDHPGLKGLIMARETNSFRSYYQQYGRLVRPIIENGNIIETKKTLVDLTNNSKRFGDIRGITYEKNDYTNGWGMWNDNRLLTGHPSGNWDMPLRKTLISRYNNKDKKTPNSKEVIKDMFMPFGKYKNKSLIKSFEKDKGYFMWMMKEFKWNKYNMNIKKTIEQLLNRDILHGR